MIHKECGILSAQNNNLPILVEIGNSYIQEFSICLDHNVVEDVILSHSS